MSNEIMDMGLVISGQTSRRVPRVYWLGLGLGAHLTVKESLFLKAGYSVNSRDLCSPCKYFG